MIPELDLGALADFVAHTIRDREVVLWESMREAEGDDLFL